MPLSKDPRSVHGVNSTSNGGIMSTNTQAGTAELQGRLWSGNAAAWAELHEQYTAPAYIAALDALGVGEGTRMLDIGCGAGLALRLAAERGVDVAGLDAAPALLEYARRRVPGATIVQGELQSLPFPDDAFDAVTGFNSFQYAADRSRRCAKPNASPRQEAEFSPWSGAPPRCASLRRTYRASAR
jgi:SAM-dependent methyltransferase